MKNYLFMIEKNKKWQNHFIIVNAKNIIRMNKQNIIIYEICRNPSPLILKCNYEFGDRLTLKFIQFNYYILNFNEIILNLMIIASN